MSQSKLISLRFGKWVVPALVSVGVVALGTINACSPSDRSTAAREEVIAQNALDAEHADEQMSKGDKAAAADATKTAAMPKQPKVKPDHKTTKTAAGEAKSSATEKTARQPASAGGTYVVQVGAFKVKENAEKLHALLKEAGYAVDLQTISHSKNGLLHLVRIAPIGNRAEAETMVEDLSAKHELKAQILNLSATH